MSHDDGRLLIGLFVISFNCTFLLRMPVMISFIETMIYALWFLIIDSSHSLGSEAALAFVSIIQGAALASFCVSELHLTRFVPHTNAASEKMGDVWVHHIDYWAVVPLTAAITGVAIGWYAWNWTWSFMIVAAVYTAIIMFSVLVIVSTLKEGSPTVHGVWLASNLWFIIFTGAAQEIDQSTDTVVWVNVVFWAYFVLIVFISAVTNVFWPPKDYANPRNGVLARDSEATLLYTSKPEITYLGQEQDRRPRLRFEIVRMLIGCLRGDGFIDYQDIAQPPPAPPPANYETNRPSDVLSVDPSAQTTWSAAVSVPSTYYATAPAAAPPPPSFYGTPAHWSQQPASRGT